MQVTCRIVDSVDIPARTAALRKHIIWLFPRRWQRRKFFTHTESWVHQPRIRNSRIHRMLDSPHATRISWIQTVLDSQGKRLAIAWLACTAVTYANRSLV